MNSAGRLTLKLPKIPKVRIPFFSSSKEEVEEGTFHEEIDDFDDQEPTGRRKWLPWAAVGLAYIAVIGAVGGTVYYLSSQSDAIEAEMMALRPRLVVEPLPGAPVADGQVSDSQVSDEPASDGQAGGETAPDAQDDTQDMAAAPEKATGEAGDDASGQERAASTDIPDETFQSLQPHPNPDLVEETPIGPLPKIAGDGRKPWRVYARPFNSLDTRPKVAIVITGLGLNDPITEEAVDLPGAITLAFASYAGGLPDWIQAARDAGHEVLLSLPMEPYDFPRSDPGPFALMSTHGPEEKLDKLNWVLSRATGYVGLVNFQGSKFNGNADLLQPVLRQLARRGLLYFDKGETPISVTEMVAQKVETPAVVADMVIDNPPGRASIVGQLARLESLARAQGVAVGTAHAFPATMSRLRVWTRELAAKGIVLIPLSAVAAGGYQAADAKSGAQ